MDNKEMLYLGHAEEGGGVYVTIVDLENPTLRRVRVKKISISDYKDLRSKGRLGEIELEKEVGLGTYVTFGIIKRNPKYRHHFGLSKHRLGEIAINTEGKYVVLHTDFVSEYDDIKVTKSGYKEREYTDEIYNNLELPQTHESVVELLGDIYEGGIVQPVTAREPGHDDILRVLQYYLQYGLLSSPHSSTIVNLGNERIIEGVHLYGEPNILYSLFVGLETLKDVTLHYVQYSTKSDTRCMLSDVNLENTNLVVESEYSDSSDSSVRCMLSIGGNNHLGGGVTLEKGNSVNLHLSGKVSSEYIASAAKLDGVELELEGVVIVGTLSEFVQLDTTMSTSRILKADITGDVVMCVGDKVIQWETDTMNVLNNSNLGRLKLLNKYKEGCVMDSYNETKIEGDVDISDVVKIVSSFNGEVGGGINLGQGFSFIKGKCFSGYDIDEILVEDISNDGFVAGLDNENIKLKVKGETGVFKGCNVRELEWITSAYEILAGQFTGSYVTPTNEVGTVETIRKGAFNKYEGRVLDLRVFTNLKEIESGGIKDCANLDTILIGEGVKLNKSSIENAPSLTRVYIGSGGVGINPSTFKGVGVGLEISTLVDDGTLKSLSRSSRYRVVYGISGCAVLERFREEEKIRRTDIEMMGSLVGLSDIPKADLNAADIEPGEFQLLDVAYNTNGYGPTIKSKYEIVHKLDEDIKGTRWEEVAESTTPEWCSLPEVESKVMVSLMCQLYRVEKNVVGYANIDKVSYVVEMGNYGLYRGVVMMSRKEVSVYVLIRDKRIVHAFTGGKTRDEVMEVFREFARHVLAWEVCGLVKYSTEYALIGSKQTTSFVPAYYQRDYRNGMRRSWMPVCTVGIGDFKGILGVDLHTGDKYIYPYKSKSVAVNEKKENGFYARLKEKSVKCSDDISNLEAVYISNISKELQRLVELSKGKRERAGVEEVKYSNIIEDKEKAGKLLRVLQGEEEISSEEIIGLLKWSELFKERKRVESCGRELETGVKLLDGSIKVEEYYNKLGCLWCVTGECSAILVSVLRYNAIIDLLKLLVTREGKLSSRRNTMKLEGFEKLNLLQLRVCMPHKVYKEEGLGELSSLRLSICRDTLQVCLHVDKYKEGSKEYEGSYVYYWFGSIEAALKCAKYYKVDMYSEYPVSMVSNSIGGKALCTINGELRETAELDLRELTYFYGSDIAVDVRLGILPADKYTKDIRGLREVLKATREYIITGESKRSGNISEAICKLVCK